MLAAPHHAAIRRRKRLSHLCWLLLTLALATGLLSLLGSACITWSHHPGESLRNFHGDTPTWAILLSRGVLSFVTFTPGTQPNKPWSITLDTRFDPGFRWRIPDSANPRWPWPGIGVATTSGAFGSFRWFSISLTWPLLALAPITVFLHRRARIPPPGRCPLCGYDLRASPTRCPECGSPVPADHSIKVGQ